MGVALPTCEDFRRYRAGETIEIVGQAIEVVEKVAALLGRKSGCDPCQQIQSKSGAMGHLGAIGGLLYGLRCGQQGGELDFEVRIARPTR